MSFKIYLPLSILMLGLNLSAQNDRVLFSLQDDRAIPAESESVVPIPGQLELDPLTLPAEFSARVALTPTTAINIRFDEQPRQRTAADVAIWYGSSSDPAWAHLPNYRDAVLTVNRATGQLVLLSLTSAGTYSIAADPAGNYAVQAAPVHDCESDVDGTPGFPAAAKSISQAKSLQMMNCGERDGNGDYVVDMLFGFSHEARALIGDINAYSVAQVETVNMGLQNTEIQNLRLRLVDIAVRDAHFGLFNDNINTFYDVFEPDILAVGADMAAFFDAEFPMANNGGGFGFVPGRACTNFAGSPTVFRHEWGHNSGSRHCPEDDGGTTPYASGSRVSAGMATHMCGNATNFYSNPDLMTADGAPLGIEDTADNHRNITERREIYSSYAEHVIAYTPAGAGNCASTIAEGRYYIQNVASDNYLSTVSTGFTGDKIDQSATTGGLQTWELHQASPGLFYVYNAQSGRTLDAFGGSTSPGNDIGVWTPTAGNARQLWSINPASAGAFTMSPSISNLCLQIPAGMTEEDDLVIQDECDGTTDTEWRFIAVPLADGENPSVTVELTTTPSSCNVPGDGTVDLTVNGGDGVYTYLWDTGETTQDLAATTVGAHSVVITTGGRDYFTTASVFGGAPLIPSLTTTDGTPGNGGATITVNSVTNSTAPLSYAWSDGGSGATRSNLDAGIYTLTITDANGCQDISDIKVYEGPAEATPYLIQHVESGLYVHSLTGGTGAINNPLVLGDCPTEDAAYVYTLEKRWGNLFQIVDPETDRRVTNIDQDAVGDPFTFTRSTGSNQNYFAFTETGPNTYTLVNNHNFSSVGVAGNEINDQLVQLAEGATGAEFRLVPTPTCSPAVGTACDDGDNTTDNDQINFGCSCCGQPNECFGIGDADGDGECADTDCDDNEATIFLGAPCDDGDPATVADAITADCACLGRPTNCSETGEALNNVAPLGSVSVRNTLDNPNTAPPEALIDGNRNGNFPDGTVWHSASGFAWASVDLVQEQEIKEIAIFSRTDCCQERLGNTSVFVSDAPWSGPDLSRAELRAEADFEFLIPDTFDDDNITVPVGISGRYVRLKAGSAQMNIAEIEVRVCPRAQALSVTLLTFSGQPLKSANLLEWTTADERDNAGFWLQRSVDGRAFDDLAFVPGTDNATAQNNYSFEDANPFSGRTLYRLRQIDFDGSQALSRLIAVDRKDGAGWLAYPNPVGRDKELRIGLANESEAGFELYALTGQLVKTFSDGATRLPLSDIPSGVYLLRNREDAAVRRVVIR